MDLSIEERQILITLDSRYFGFIKTNTTEGEKNEKLINKGIEYFEAILFWLYQIEQQKNPTTMNTKHSNSLTCEQAEHFKDISREDCFSQLGHFHLLLENYVQALSAYQFYMKLNSKYWQNSSMLYGLALVYFHFGAFHWSKHLFLQTLYVEPNFARGSEIHVRLAIIYKYLNSNAQSLKHFRLSFTDRFSQCSIPKAEINYNISCLFDNIGKKETAIDFLERLISKDAPSSPEISTHIKTNALKQLAWILFSTAFSQSDLRTSSHPSEPTNKPALESSSPVLPKNSLACTKSDTSIILSRCISLLQASLKLDSTNGQSWYFLGRCFAKQGQIHDAFVSYRQSIDKSEASAHTWASIGVLYQQQNQAMDALQAYICAVQLDRKFAPAWVNLALLYEACGMLFDAFTCYTNAIRAGDPNPALPVRVSKLKEFISANPNFSSNANNNSNNNSLLSLKASTASVSSSSTSSLANKKASSNASHSEVLGGVNGTPLAATTGPSLKPLPSIEEAWNLPIPVELTSTTTQNNSNSGSKYPAFMSKYLEPLLTHKKCLEEFGSKGSGKQLKRSFVADINHTNAIDSQQFSTFSRDSSDFKNFKALDHNLVSTISTNQMQAFSQNSITIKQEKMMNYESNNTAFNTNGFCLDRTSSFPSKANIFKTGVLTQTYAKSITLPKFPSQFSGNQILQLQNSTITAENEFLLYTDENGPPHLFENPIPYPFLLDNKDDKKNGKQSSNTDFKNIISTHHSNPSAGAKETKCAKSSLLSSTKSASLENANSFGMEHFLQEIPCITIASKKQAFSNDLRDFSFSQPATLIKGLCQTLKLDLSLFSTKTLSTAHPNHLMEVRTQFCQPPEKNFSDVNGTHVSWMCNSTRQHMPIIKYAKYQGATFKRALEDEKCQVRTSSISSTTSSQSNTSSTTSSNTPQAYANPNSRSASLSASIFDTFKICDDEKRVGDVLNSDSTEDNFPIPFKKILFGTNVDLSVALMWSKQLEELSKLPTFLKVNSPANMLTHIGHTILGMNSVQLYMKVPGSRTPGHQENLSFSAININIGPGDSKWYITPQEYWKSFRELCSEKGVDFSKDPWWPNLEDLKAAKIPVYVINQKPGDVVWLNPGTIHWVQATGWCNNVAWNVGPITAYQYVTAIEHYSWNRYDFYKSIVPMISLSWCLARNIRISCVKLYTHIKYYLYKSLIMCQYIKDFVENLGKSLNWHGHNKDDLTHYCEVCEVEVFNFLFVRKYEAAASSASCSRGKYTVHCFNCSRMYSPTLISFSVLQQYDIKEDLAVVYDAFKLHSYTTSGYHFTTLNHTPYPDLASA